MDGLNKQCQTGGPHKNFVAQCQCLAFEFGLQKIVLQKKKNFVSLNYVKIASIAVMKIIIFKKKFKELFSEKCKEISIESIFSKKKYMQQCFSNCVLWKICRCAASLYKVLYTHTNFLPKLRKYCHEVMVNICCKSLVAVQVMAREIINFFLEISTISSYIT